MRAVLVLHHSNEDLCTISTSNSMHTMGSCVIQLCLHIALQACSIHSGMHSDSEECQHSSHLLRPAIHKERQEWLPESTWSMLGVLIPIHGAAKPQDQVPDDHASRCLTCKPLQQHACPAKTWMCSISIRDSARHHCADFTSVQ